MGVFFADLRIRSRGETQHQALRTARRARRSRGRQRLGDDAENASASGSVSYSVTNDAFLFQGGYHLAGGNTGAGNVPNNLYHYKCNYYYRKAMSHTWWKTSWLLTL
jgi:hypothetical protein